MASIKCWFCKGTHTSVDAVKDCHYQGAYDEYDADAAYERHLENAGYDQARLQDDMEARAGVLSFTDAWDLASPGTRAGYVGAC